MARGSWLGDIRITRGARALLIASTAASLVYLLVDEATRARLGGALFASGESLFERGYLWTLVTSPLVEHDFVPLLFQGLMLWMFLPSLERWWGTKKFMMFALYTSIAGVVGGALVGFLLAGGHALVPVAGLDPFIFGGILAFGVLYADQPVRFFGAIPMTGRQMAIGITGLTFLLLLVGQKWVEGGANVAAMLLALAMTSTRGNPRLWWLKWKQARIRRRLGVIDGGKKPPTPWVN